MVKPNYGDSIDRDTLAEVIVLFEDNLRLLHPFMPFITEEIWHFIGERDTGEALVVSNCLRPSPLINPALKILKRSNKSWRVLETLERKISDSKIN